MHYTLLSIVGFFKTVVIIIGVYYLFKVVARIYMPAIIKAVTKQVLKRADPNYQAMKETDKKRKEASKKRREAGKVTVDKGSQPQRNNKGGHPISSHKVVEDVEFEEID